MLRGGLVKRTGSHHDGVRRCREESHNETVRLVESADIASPGFAREFVADYAVNRAHEVTDHIGPLGTGWREPQIAAVSNSQLLRQNGRLGCFLTVDQRADDFWQGSLLGQRLCKPRPLPGLYQYVIAFFFDRATAEYYVRCAQANRHPASRLVSF